MNPIPYDEAHLAPLTTDREIEERVSQLIGRANVRQLWLMFLDSEGVQLPLMIPVDGLPSSPAGDETAHLVARLGEVMVEIGASSIVTVWERYGATRLTAQDAVWARALKSACAEGGVKLRGMLLSHRTGVRWIAQDDYEAREPATEQPTSGDERISPEDRRAGGDVR
jgi:hypothetical protein